MGEAPRISPRFLKPNYAQSAINCKLQSGELRPWNGTTVANTPSKVGTKKSIYLFADTYWLHWLEEVDITKGFVAGDTSERTYFTGQDYPRVTDNTLALTGGGTDYPINSYRLGMPAPASAPSVSCVDDMVTYDPSLLESRSYVYTYVTAWGEEGPPSPPSAVVDGYPARTWQLTAMDTAPSGNYNIAYKRIYRVNTGSAGSEFQYVGTVAVASTSYDDTVAGADLGEVLATATWIAPPDDMIGLISTANGIMFGFAGNVLYPSEVFVPYAYPEAYQLTTDFPIVALVAFGATVAVLTEGVPYLVTGVDPSALTMDKLEVEDAACVSKRGVVDFGYMALYPTVAGLNKIGTGIVQNATEALITYDEWQALNPSSIHAYYVQGRYIGFYDTGAVQGGFIFDPKNPSLIFIDLYATAGFHNPKTGKLYLQIDDDIVEWDSDSSNPLTYTWKSKLFVTPEINFGVCQIFGSGGDVTFKLYANGVLRHLEEVAFNEPFWLPSDFRGDRWEIQVEGVGHIESIVVADTLESIANDQAD